MKPKLLVILASAVFLASCGIEKKLNKSARQQVLEDPALRSAHVGISIFEPATGHYWYNYQADKYFVPASNTKIPTCYAAMKYLGDSLPGLLVYSLGDRIAIYGTGDPTLLHPDFTRQPVIDYLQQEQRKIVAGPQKQWRENSWGAGWSWSDYDADYMPERSVLPIYVNVIRFSGTRDKMNIYPRRPVANPDNLIPGSTTGSPGSIDQVSRALHQNNFTVYTNGSRQRILEVPFLTSPELGFQLLADTLHKSLDINSTSVLSGRLQDSPMYRVIRSQPTDSMLYHMMHRSDNFYAEQSLLMVSNQLLGYMSDARIVDTLLKTDFSDLPQRPRWADGSGLSRYNLFTPQDFVMILNKMKNEFGMDRVRRIFQTGNTGTLTNYYVKDSGSIYAKTGTLSGVVALSGFLYTRQNKLLLFSVQVNNQQGPASQVRRAVERFLEGVREKY